MPVPDAAEVFRDFDTKDVPASGTHEVTKPDVRNYLAQVEASLALIDTALSSDMTNAAYRAEYLRRRFTFASAF